MNIKCLISLLIIALLSCGNDPCENLNCGDHGRCDEATETCICEQFYEGALCGEESRKKFLANWSGTGVCDYNPGNIFNLVVTISGGLEIDDIQIQSTSILQNFTMSGQLTENNDIVISKFQPHISANTYDGSIVLENGNNNLVMTLNAYVNGAKNTCKYRLSK